MDMHELNGMLNRLANFRKINAEAKQIKTTLLEDVKVGLAYQQAESLAKDTDAAIEELEAEIRKAGVELKVAGAEIPDRIEVKKDTTVDIIDEQKAKTWAMTNYTPALKLDMTKIAQAAKKGDVPADIATVTEGWKTYISKDLGNGNAD